MLKKKNRGNQLAFYAPLALASARTRSALTRGELGIYPHAWRLELESLRS